MRYDLTGNWTITANQVQKQGQFPGTLDTNGIGNNDKVAKPWHPDIEDRNKHMEKDAETDPRINSRFTRLYTYEGEATFQRTFDEELSSDKRLFIVAERARALSLNVDGTDIPSASGCLSTPYVFEVTGILHKGSTITFTCDNSYQGLPYKDIVFSSAATDETQTNWNGIIGDIYVEERDNIFLSDIMVYPHGNKLDVRIVIDVAENAVNVTDMKVVLSCPYLADTIESPVEIDPSDDCTVIELTDLELSDNYGDNLWDEGKGNLCDLTVALLSDAKEITRKNVRFGIRDFSYDSEGRLAINGRRFFLRSEANCAVFPETGFPPMDKESWTKILKTYASYGVNCMRFHSWCPPETAFSAADELGMMMQPELSHWNPRDAFKSSESREYYQTELLEILWTYANHPSFVMLSLGNELITDEEGVAYMHELLSIAKRTDNTRLFAWGSNNFYGANGVDKESDFYTSARFKDKHIRLSGVKGLFNKTYPNAKNNFSEIMKDLRKDYDKPVFGFEVGQYEVSPDIDEIDEFKGVTKPDNYNIVKDKLKALGITDEEWKKRIAATGELALIGYREEVEAVMRTPEMSGLSLLGLQDFPGQGTALVGMLNSHLETKAFPFAEPSRFNSFFTSKALLVLLDRYTYVAGEVIKADVLFANYSHDDFFLPVKYAICEHSDSSAFTSDNTCKSGTLGEVHCPAGTLTNVGTIEIPLADYTSPKRLDLAVYYENTDIRNTYPVWVYPDVTPVCPDSVYETEVFDEKAIKILEAGGKVFLAPHSTEEALPHSAKAQFSTDFWSVGTFPNQEGTMGQLILKDHPLFKTFPTEEFTNYQWWPMASQRAFILPRYMDTLVTEMDSYATLRPMSQLYEVKCLGGKLMASSMGLQDLQEYPEARALLHSIYSYMDSDEFNPVSEMTADDINKTLGRFF